MSWSEDENLVLFVAEAARSEAKSFFAEKERDRPSDSLEELGTYRDNWGEQLADKSRSVICIADLRNKRVRVIREPFVWLFLPGAAGFRSGNFGQDRLHRLQETSFRTPIRRCGPPNDYPHPRNDYPYPK